MEEWAGEVMKGVGGKEVGIGESDFGMAVAMNIVDCGLLWRAGRNSS